MVGFNQKGTAPVLLILAVVGLAAFLLVASTFSFKNTVLDSLYPKPLSQAAFVAPSPFPGCPLGNHTPVGQANPSIEYEPMGAIWCFPLTQMPITRITGANDWVDDFNTNIQMGRLDSGDMDYVVYNDMVPEYSTVKHWVNANHWMVDLKPQKDTTPDGWAISAGGMMRPNKAFRWENRKLIIEVDVGAGVPDYVTHDIWPEIAWTTASGPTGISADFLYMYGKFGGAWSAGCRIQAGRSTICASHNANIVPTAAEGKCSSIPGANRMMEISAHQQCGSTHFGGNVYSGNRPWRACQTNQMDIFCRDRFRFEYSQSGLLVYVNGERFFEDSNWPTSQYFPEEIVNGSTPIYVYFGQWGRVLDKEVYRFHWDRVAVNPHDLPTHNQPPTQAPSYCPGQPQDTCPMIMTSEAGLPAVSKNTVDILDFVMSPQDIVVQQGTTVTWTNRGVSPHSVTSDTGAFDSGIFNSNQTFSYTFNTPGTFTYHCDPHPSMKGSVKVLAADGSVPSSSPTPTPLPSATPVTTGITFNLTMNGASNVPVVSTNGTGSGTLILSQNQTAATLTMSYSGLTSAANNAHIHGPAAPNQNAAAIYPVNFTAATSGNNVQTTITGLTAQQVTDLMNGYWYVNVHSVNFPNGEIRGQLLRPGQTPPPNTTPTPSASPATLVGDINGSGKVDIFDYNLLVTAFGQSGTNPADINNSGKVDIFDYNLLITNFGRTQ